MRVLLVEDDELLGDGVNRGLTQFNHTVDWVKDGEAALRALSVESFDCIVLDLGLPKRSGLDVLKTLRGKYKIKAPVLILTARDTIQDRVSGLDAGADDYLTKPFNLEELCARMRALQRRTAERASPTLTYGDIAIDPASHSVTLKKKPVVISRREFSLLQKLLENVGRVISREHLSQSLYGWGDDIDSNALEVHIHNLRKKLGTDLIKTIRGVGYMVEKAKS